MPASWCIATGSPCSGLSALGASQISVVPGRAGAGPPRCLLCLTLLHSGMSRTPLSNQAYTASVSLHWCFFPNLWYDGCQMVNFLIPSHRQLLTICIFRELLHYINYSTLQNALLKEKCFLWSMRKYLRHPTVTGSILGVRAAERVWKAQSNVRSVNSCVLHSPSMGKLCPLVFTSQCIDKYSVLQDTLLLRRISTLGTKISVCFKT